MSTLLNEGGGLTVTPLLFFATLGKWFMSLTFYYKKTNYVKPFYETKMLP